MPKRIKNNRDSPKGWIRDVKALDMICQVAYPRFYHNFIVQLLRKFVANIISSDYPTNSSQSDTLHNHICKEQVKDWFYSNFVLQSIIKMFKLN